VPASTLSRRQLLVGSLIGLVLVGGTVASYLLTREPEAPPISVSVQVDTNAVVVTTDPDDPQTVTVTINYSNNRDALFTNVVVLLRPMTGASIDSADAQSRVTPNGIEFALGDIGPYAGGAINVDLTFATAGSRVVQATISAKELTTPSVSNTETVSVVAPR
jgi:hypothetical protein